MPDLNLTAVQHWSERVYAWIGEDQAASPDPLPDYVVRHFVEHIPALVVRVQHLTAELAATRQMLDMVTAPDGPATR